MYQIIFYLIEKTLLLSPIADFPKLWNGPTEIFIHNKQYYV